MSLSGGDQAALIGSLVFVFVVVGFVCCRVPPGPTDEERRARAQSIEFITTRDLQIEIAKNTRVIADHIKTLKPEYVQK